MVLDTLSAAFNLKPSSPAADIVAKIQAVPLDPQDLRPAQGSLADVLRQTPSGTEFELDAWNQQWSAVEEELRTMTQADDRAEGRA